MRLKILLLCSLWQVCRSANIVDVAIAEGYTTAIDLARKVNALDVLEGKGPLTCFLPTNEAFVKTGAVNYGDILHMVFMYHCVSGSFRSTELKNDQTIPTLQGASLRINKYRNGTDFAVNGNLIARPDIPADNGIIHGMTSSLERPVGNIADVIQHTQNFSNLLTTLEDADMMPTLRGPGPYTLFAPTNDAFSKVSPSEIAHLLVDKPRLTKLLLRHIVKGTVFSIGLESEPLISIGGEDVSSMMRKEIVAKIVAKDDIADNGVVHGVDNLML